MPRLPAILLLCLAYWSSAALGLTLTQGERDWLQAHPELRLGVDATWPPFEFRDSEGHYQGLTADYINLLEKRLGVRIQPVEPSSWSQVLEMAKSGKLNLLPGVMATPERETYLAFTKPYLDFPIVILARRQGPQPQTIQDLEGLKVAVVQDYAPHELLRTRHPGLILKPQPNTQTALQALATGEVDAMVGDLASSAWSLRQARLEGLQISGETPYRYQLAMAAPRDQAVLIGIIDKLLDELTPQEISAIQERWIGSDLIYPSPWRKALLFGLPALLALTAILLFVLRINRRLRQEIDRRQVLEQALRNSASHYRGLVESLNAVAWQMHPEEGRFTYVSPHAEKLFGYPLSDWLEPGFWKRILHPDDLAQQQLAIPTSGDQSQYLRLVAADGRILWVRSIATLIEEQGEQLLRGLLIDSTEAKLTEQALRQSEQKFASVFHNCPDIMVISRQSDGRILALNRAFEEQLGISPGEALGHTATELGIWGLQDMGSTLLTRLQHEALHNLEVPFLRRHGEGFVGLLSAQPIQFGGTPALVVVVRDISRLKAAEQQLKISEEKFAKAFHALPDGILLSRMRDGMLLETNEGFTRITGHSPEDVRGHSTTELGIWAHSEDREWLIQQVRARDSVRDFTAPIRTRNGDLRLCEISAQLLNIANEPCMLAIARDVTDSTRMQENLRQAATVFESTAEGVLITDLEQNITAINRAFTTITGYSEAEVLGQTPRLLRSEQHDSAFFTSMWHQLAAQGHWQGEIWNRRKDGEVFPSWLTINAVRDTKQRITHFVGVFADITSLKQAQARLDYQAHHDPLTGLPNRLLFESRLREALEDAESAERHGAVMFLDLDHFKHINDSLGHPIGDLLLKGIAQRLREQLRDIDTVARLGGDEFILLLPGLHHPRDAEQLAHKLLNSLRAPFRADEHEFFISASIGISLYPDDGSDVASIVKNADAAMYRSKARGRSRIEFYTSDLTFEASERMALENELRRAIEHEELQLHFQPKLSLSDFSLVGAEALIRWRHPVYGEIPPERFIPLAEECGLILPLGDWVMQEACRQMRSWQLHYQPFGPLSVNLAGPQLRQPHLVGRLQQLLEANQLSASSLQLEITEGFIMSQAEEALTILHALKELGVELAIDDFGTGYSSLSYLKRLPLNILKIDQSFIDGLPNDSHDLAIVRAILALASSMQLTVIAEGVETEAQRDLLQREGCQQMQGYLISRPLPAIAFASTFLQPLTADSAAPEPPI